MSIVTIEDIRAYITFEAGSDRETFIADNLIPAAEKWAVTRLGFDPAKISHEETFFRGGVSDTLTISRYPIASVEEVSCDGEVVEGFESDLSMGMIYGGFGPGRWKVKFSTVAAQDPDIKDAVCQFVAWKYQLIQNEGYGVRNRIQGDSIISIETNVPRSIIDALDLASKRYRK